MKHKTKLPPAPRASSPSVRASMQGNRPSATRPEKRLHLALQSHGIWGYEVNYRLLPGTPDFAFFGQRLAIFVHGCFWHRCPYCKPHFPNSNQGYWTAKLARNKARDKYVRTRLKAIGWRSVVVWECILKKDVARTVSRILRHLRSVGG